MLKHYCLWVPQLGIDYAIIQFKLYKLETTSYFAFHNACQYFAANFEHETIHIVSSNQERITK